MVEGGAHGCWESNEGRSEIASSDEPQEVTISTRFVRPPRLTSNSHSQNNILLVFIIFLLPTTRQIYSQTFIEPVETSLLPAASPSLDPPRPPSFPPRSRIPSILPPSLLQLYNSMGNCLSDPSSDGKPKTSSAGGQRLGSTATPKPTSAPPKSNIHTLASSSSPAPQQNSVSGKNNYQGGRNTLGDGFEDPVRAQGEGGAREAALRAAEERQAKVSVQFARFDSVEDVSSSAWRTRR